MKLSIYLDPDTLAALDTLARDRNLSRSSTIAMLLAAYAPAPLAPANNPPSLPISATNRPVSTIGTRKPAPKGGKL
jgi:hypothetical protein